MSTATQSASNDDVLSPHPKQLPFLRRHKRYHAFVSGIGAGKTVAGILRMLKNVEHWNPGETGYVIAPTVPSLRNVIIPELDKWGILDRCDYNRSENHLTFPNGSKVILESADNDRKIQRLRGPSIAWFWMDEAATIAPRAWEVMIGRLRAGEYRNAFVTTTPNGYNWVYDRFAEDDPDDVNQVFDVPTTANPHLPEDYREEIVEEYEGQFYEQEVRGQFMQPEGLVYPWFDKDGDTLEDAPDVRELDEVVYGQDWGFNNPAATVALGRQGDRWVVLEEFYESNCTNDDVAQRVKQMQEAWLSGPVYCDPSEPSAIEEFERKGLKAKKADNSVTPGISKVTQLGEQDRLKVYEGCQNWINEAQQYQWKGDDSDDPEKVNDHLMDATRYGLFSHLMADTGQSFMVTKRT